MARFGGNVLRVSQDFCSLELEKFEVLTEHFAKMLSCGSLRMLQFPLKIRKVLLRFFKL